MDAFANASAIILAGGKSSRMGRPKILLNFAGEPLIAHIARTVGSLFTDVVVVTPAEYELWSLPVGVIRYELIFQRPVGGMV